MALQLDVHPSSGPNATGSQPLDAGVERYAAAHDPSRPAAARSAWVDGEYAMSDAAQRNRAQQSPAIDTSASPAANNDLARLGAGFGNTRPPQMLWNEHSVNVVGDAGRKQNGLTDAQAQTNAALAGAVMQASGATSGPLPLAPADLAMLLQASGLPYEKQDPGQLVSATRYINAAPDAGNQQERLRKALDGFHILNGIGHPALTSQEMKDLLWGAANVPGHAFGTMSVGEVAARYQDVAAALNGAPGKHEVKIGKHNLKIELDAQGHVTESSTKKPGVLGKIGKFALTVASFVPIPMIAIPARIASAAISAVEGIKNGNWMQAIAGAASGVAAGAGAIAGKAIAGAAATTAKIATQAANAANAVQAGINAARGKNALGIFATALQTTANAAGAFATGAGAVADAAKQVQTWANRTLVGTMVTVNLKQGNIGAAMSNGAALTAAIAGDFKNPDGTVKPGAAQVQRYAGYGADAGGILAGLQQRDIASVLNAGSRLATRIDAQLTPGPQTGPGAKVAEYLAYAGSGINIGRSIREGSVDKTLERTSALLGQIDRNHGDADKASFADLRSPLQKVRDWLDQAVALLRGKPLPDRSAVIR